MRRATTPPDSAHRLAWTREVRFEGRLIHVVVDSCELADGSSVHREIVLHPGAAAILPVFSDGHVLLVSQYRRPVDETLWEIPAGKLEPGESFLVCAQRELAEETGYTAGSWQELVMLYTTPGFSDERIALFLARNLVKSSDPEAGEIDRCRSFALDEVARMIAAGELRDAKTILAIEHYRASLSAASRED